MVALRVLVVQEIVQRWFYLMNRRLAAAKIEQLKSQVNDAEPHKPVSGEAMPQISREPELKIFTISAQNRQLLHMFIGFALVIGLWMIWDDVLPALGVFKRIQLWEQVTLGGFVLAIVIAIMTFVAGKNLPGLLEVTLLHRLPLDAGLRFAITSICRYFIIVVGFATAFDLVGIGWAKVQWLIAAMTVGLGFGLQEIFANFVSGLIILFERPIRVGDIVTVGDVSGAVSRIHIRATTIVDWDRKEMIVPNKEFITGRVVNWTLSDRVIRLMVKVGVAYGSDTDKVQKLLLEAAESVSGILNEPAPSAIFCGFGDSCLDFELRAYIPNVDNTLALKHSLYSAVNRKLIEGRITIPFPQRDINIHIDESTWPLNLKVKKDKDTHREKV
jgi:potassium efflux system protein